MNLYQSSTGKIMLWNKSPQILLTSNNKLLVASRGCRSVIEAGLGWVFFCLSWAHACLGVAGCWLTDLGWRRLALQAELSLCHTSLLQLAGYSQQDNRCRRAREGCQPPKA